MSNYRIDRLISDFEAHCRGERIYALDKVMGELKSLIITDVAQKIEGTESFVTKALETALLSQNMHNWQHQEFLVDATLAYCDHFAPSINMVNRLVRQSPDMRQRIIEAHCDQGASPIEFIDWKGYAQVLKNPDMPVWLGEKLMQHVIDSCLDPRGFATSFPLSHLMVQVARYEYRDFLTKNEAFIIESKALSTFGFSACEVSRVRALWDIGLKDLAKEVFADTSLLPHNDDLMWIRQTPGIEPHASWAVRCWRSFTQEVVQGIVQYYLEYGDIEGPTESVEDGHLYTALSAYAQRPDVYTSDRYAELIDTLVASTDDSVKNPNYHKLPRQALENSTLYMERQLQSDLGL